MKQRHLLWCRRNWIFSCKFFPLALYYRTNTNGDTKRELAQSLRLCMLGWQWQVSRWTQWSLRVFSNLILCPMAWAIAPLLAWGDFQNRLSVSFRQTRLCWTIQIALWHIYFGNKPVSDFSAPPFPVPPPQATQTLHSVQMVLPLGSDSFLASQEEYLNAPHRC